MRRGLATAVALVVVALLLYWFLLREKSVAPTVSSPTPAAVLGEGDDAVVVSGKGVLVRWLPVPEEEGALPRLPEAEPPPSGRFAGPMLEQARVLGAVPDQLRPYVARSFYGEEGLGVELAAGIELRFGDATQAARKWRAAAAVLADPSITAADYVDLQAPMRPAVYGEGHLLPPVE